MFDVSAIMLFHSQLYAQYIRFYVSFYDLLILINAQNKLFKGNGQ